MPSCASPNGKKINFHLTNISPMKQVFMGEVNTSNSSPNGSNEGEVDAGDIVLKNSYPPDMTKWLFYNQQLIFTNKLKLVIITMMIDYIQVFTSMCCGGKTSTRQPLAFNTINEPCEIFCLHEPIDIILFL